MIVNGIVYKYSTSIHNLGSSKTPNYRSKFFFDNKKKKIYIF